MTQLRPLLLIALIANLLTIILYCNAANQPGGTGAAMAFGYMWFPSIWIVAFVSAMFFILRKNNMLFQNGMAKWTVPTLLFCTPVPVILIFRLIH